MSRLSQQYDAITVAAKAVGASVRFEQRESGHICAELTAASGRTGKIFVASSPSDTNAYKAVRKETERRLRELMGIKIAPKEAPPSAKQVKRRPPCAAPQQREQSLPRYRARHPGEYNSMSTTLRALLKDGGP